MTTAGDSRTVEQLGAVHFIGIGGAGMSAIARILLARGIPVSGSDARASAELDSLAALGARIHVGHNATALSGVDTVVVSSAIRDSNPELAAARNAGLPVLHRSEALAAAMTGSRVIAVAGTHGKTTTTSMITVLLRGAGLDPSFAIGGTVPALGVNAAAGRSDVFVAEADESDGSFLNYRPQIAVVTNVEPDHLDHYGTAQAVYAAFDNFAALLPAGGALVACADDEGARALARRAADAGTRVVLYGTSPEADVRLSGLEPGTGIGTTATLTLGGTTNTQALPLVLQVPGAHNALNAAAAVAVALELGLPAGTAVQALAAFSGAARRFEAKGEAAGVRVYDDYAHHPTEVLAALTAARAVAGTHRVHVLFQPHLFSRTREFAAEFAAALDLADTVAVLDIYPAREDPIPGVTSALITDRMRTTLVAGTDTAVAVRQLSATAAPGDIILTVGAGDVTQQGQALLDVLQGPAGKRGTRAEPIAAGKPDTSAKPAPGAEAGTREQ
jgi:UDP-N-acetylmuramate--alanine ligase